MSNFLESSNIKIDNNKLNSYIPKNLVKYNKVITINNRYQNKIIDYISLIKIIACLSVIILHTNSEFWHFSYNNYKQYWKSANLLECIFYFAVPFFILSIGATLMDFNEKYGLIIYFKRRIKKVVIPLLCWNIITYYYNIYIIKVFKKEKITFVYLWNLFFKSRLNPILSSLHSFIIIYMFIPLIAYVEKNKKIKIYSYCFFSLLITQIIIPYLIKLYKPKMVWVYQINIDKVIYIFPGYIIQNYNFSNSIKLKIYIFGIIGFFIHFYGTQILTLKYGKIILLHKGYENFPCVIYSCSLFLLIKENSHLLFRITNKNYINKIGTLTFGPFFLHLPIKDAYDKYYHPNKFSLT
jgi:surface polysaccharide O-acyltransferase-like enzyme